MANEYTTINVDMTKINGGTEDGTLTVYWYKPITLGNGDTIAARPQGQAFTVTAGAATIQLAATDTAVLNRDLPYLLKYTDADGKVTTLGQVYVTTSSDPVELADLLGSSEASGDAHTFAYRWRGAWGSGAAYAADDLVLYNGMLYKALEGSTNRNPETQTTYWELFLPGFKHLGAWSDATAYKVGHAASYEGSSWLCIQAHTNQTPAEGAYWTLLAEAGTDGTNGTNGTDGADGASALSGSGAPGAGVGADGDTYIDVDTGDIYGPKAAGAWGAAVGNLTGPEGPEGPAANLSDATPAANAGAGSAGVGTLASRDDHSHQMPSAADVGALPDTTTAADIGAMDASADGATIPMETATPGTSIKEYVDSAVGGSGNASATVRNFTHNGGTKTNMTTARKGAGAAVVNGLIYVIGGNTGSIVNTNEVYDPDTDTWTTKAAMTTAREGLANSVVAVGTKIYAIGGNTGSVSAKCEEYDTVANTWATKTNMTAARNSAAAVAYGTDIYVFGGHNVSVQTSVYCFSTTGNSWTTKTAMTTAMYTHTAGVIGAYAYVVGGNTGAGSLTTHLRYDFAGDSWSSMASLGTARSLGASAVINGELYFVGGQDGSSYSAVLEKYTPGTNSWATLTSMPTARNLLTAAAVGNVLYAIGGTTGSVSAKNEAYDTAYATTAQRTATSNGLARSYHDTATLTNQTASITGTLIPFKTGDVWGPASPSPWVALDLDAIELAA